MKYLLLILFTVQAHAFDFTVNFDNLTNGRFTLATQKIAFKDPSVVMQVSDDKANTKTLMSIVSSGCKSGRCLQYFIPKGTHGTGFFITTTPTDTLNIEFDWFYKPGYDFSIRSGQTMACGKVPGFVGWNSPPNMSVGVIEELTWRANANTKGGAPFFGFLNQDDHSGHTCCGSAGYGPSIQTGRWYHVKVSMKSGASGYTKGWIDGVQYFNNGPFISSVAVSTPVVNFRTWFGCGNTTPAVDSYALMDNVHIWSGQ